MDTKAGAQKALEKAKAEHASAVQHLRESEQRLVNAQEQLARTDHEDTAAFDKAADALHRARLQVEAVSSRERFTEREVARLHTELVKAKHADAIQEYTATAGELAKLSAAIREEAAQARKQLGAKVLEMRKQLYAAADAWAKLPPDARDGLIHPHGVSDFTYLPEPGYGVNLLVLAGNLLERVEAYEGAVRDAQANRAAVED